MSMLKEVIQQIANEKGYTLKEVAHKANMNYNGLHDKFRRESITYKDIESILNVLDKKIIFVDKEHNQDKS